MCGDNTNGLFSTGLLTRLARTTFNFFLIEKLEVFLKTSQSFFCFLFFFSFSTVCWLFFLNVCEFEIILLRVDECCSYFYVNRDVFFFRFFFQAIFYFFLNGMQTAVEQLKCKGSEKRDWLLFLKMEFNYQISHRNKYLYLLIQFSQIGEI